MQTTEIRPATSTDYAQIVSLIGSPEELFLVFPNARWPFDLRQLHRLAEQRIDLHVSENDGDITGFADLYDKNPGKWAFVGNVIVRSNRRGRGIGRQLVERMLARVFVAHDLPEARISVFSENRSALGLYRKLGFSTYAKESRTGPGGKTATLLHLKLYRAAATGTD